MNPMETATSQKKLRIILIVIAAVLLVLTGILFFLSLPAIRAEANPTEPPTEAPTLAPTEPPTEVPTEPPTEGPTEEPTFPLPEENPYNGADDFHYEGRFLKLSEGESWAGIDVSRWQYDIDWERVAASGAEFAIIRIGYRGSETGRINADRYAQTNLDGAAAAGLDIGVYFFSQALTREEAEEEAYYVLDVIKDRDITMPVVFDWERVHNEKSRSMEMDRRTLTDCAKTFLETIELAGYNAMVYFNPHQSRNLYYLSELKEYDFWLASYTDRMDFPYEVDMWQYTNEGRVPGIDTECDLNVYFPSVG